MEFTNEIFFNKPLKAENTVIITYFGKLYREHSRDVSIVYGYGDNWEETDSAPMIETENSFEVTLNIKDYNTFNFCFTNSFNIWDNNFGFNYISPILPKDDEQNIETDDNKPLNDNTTDNDIDTIDEVSSTPVQEPEENNEAEETKQDTDENTEVENAKIETKDENDNIEATFSALLDSILEDANSEDETIDVSNLSGYGLQSVDTIQGELINCDEIFAQLFEELTLDDTKSNENVIQIENSQEESNINVEQIEKEEKSEIDINKVEIEEQPQENIEQIENVDKTEIEDQIEEKIEIAEKPEIDVNIVEKEEQELLTTEQAEELDTLMNSLLDSISEKAQSTEIATPIEEIRPEEIVEGSELPAIQQEEDWLDKFLNFSFAMVDKFSRACKKIGQLIKLKAKEYGFLSSDKN